MTMRVLRKNQAYEDFLTVSESGHFSVIAPKGRFIQVAKRYPMLKNVNSQQSEQINRSLRSLSVVLAFSTFEHYMKILEMYFVHKNVKTRKKL